MSSVTVTSSGPARVIPFPGLDGCKDPVLLALVCPGVGDGSHRPWPLGAMRGTLFPGRARSGLGEKARRGMTVGPQSGWPGPNGLVVPEMYYVYRDGSESTGGDKRGKFTITSRTSGSNQARPPSTAGKGRSSWLLA